MGTVFANLKTGGFRNALSNGDCHGRIGNWCCGPRARADVKEVQMLHWWTSGGEAAALNVLKGDLSKEGYAWKDVPVAGGGGDAAMTALKAMVAAGTYPTASQMLGYTVLDYAAGRRHGRPDRDGEEGRLGQVGSGSAAEVLGL
jgi:ABC-type glycerol-3-phosphate transport system substrate-binding protein